MEKTDLARCELNKQLFMNYWREIAHRDGANDCLAWLEKETDYFTAPASRKHHGAHPGGLLVHSLNVCEELLHPLPIYCGKDANRESAILVALLHDVCKCNFYDLVSVDHTLVEDPDKPAYTYRIDDTLPLGHGEKSLYLLLQTGLELTDEEAAAIRWHMGAYGDPDKLQTLGQAFDRWPLALFLHMADMIAAHYIETED